MAAAAFTATGVSLRLTYDIEAAIGDRLAVMKGTAERQVKPPTGANVIPVGVMAGPGDPAEPKEARQEVVVFGDAVVTVGAAVTRGQRLKIAGTTGKVTPIGAEGAGAAVEVIGVALDSAAADGDLIGMFVNPYHTQAEA